MKAITGLPLPSVRVGMPWVSAELEPGKNGVRFTVTSPLAPWGPIDSMVDESSVIIM